MASASHWTSTSVARAVRAGTPPWARPFSAASSGPWASQQCSAEPAACRMSFSAARPAATSWLRTA